ncbi:hypothetical protein shim_10680 [Shimia sp. SK013]|uniref:hypothetical protein n=1 Tax=Shimia sp. SK013 TaxID=1389006 RepID=UPI0006B69F9E|nr:hypothetical protein [Shimia sp. SK013]KPA22780.1 hypothetical protein shim_10680 [Shimia sp. SK013]
MKTIKDLLLAMLNATLILVALCLFLLWQVSRSGERIAESFASNLSLLKPMEQRIDETRQEVAGLRSDLAALANGTTELSDAAKMRLDNAATRLDQAMRGIEADVAKLAATPETLTDYAIDKTATRVSIELQTLLQCRQPQS